MVVHGLGAEAAALPVDGPREVRWLRQVAGCCTRDRGGAGASGITWDRGNAGATDAGSARPRHDSDMRSKRERGVAVDDRARGAGGVAVDRSMGAQRACSGGRGVWAKSDTIGPVTGNGGDVGTVTHGMEAVTGGVACCCDAPRHPCDARMMCRAVGGKGRLSSTGLVRVEGWLLVETGRGGMGARTYWCVVTSHTLKVVDGVDGWHGRSAAAEFELGKLVSKTRHGPCTHRPCVYKPNTFVCRRWDTSPQHK